MLEKILISVIIPTYRDWARLQLCLDALERQTYPKELFEIIVINNDPDDAVPVSLRLPSNCQVINERKPGSYAARNAGVKCAQGKYLAFTDADCIPQKQWLEEISLFYGDERLRLMSGKVEMFSTRTDGSTLNFAESYDYIFGINQEIYIKYKVAATANLVVPASVMKELKGFNESLYSGGDTDFCQRATSAGSDIFYNKNAVVKHPLRASKKDLLIKARRLTAGKFRRSKIKTVLMTLAPPIVRLKIMAFEKEAPLAVKCKALVTLLWIKSYQIYCLVRLFLNMVPERR